MRIKTLWQSGIMTMLMLMVSGVAFAGGSSHSTHYGKVTVSATGNGTVYISTADNATSGNTSESWNCGGNSSGDSKTYYLYANPANGYEFAGWSEENGNKILSTASPYSVSFSATSTTSGSPTTSNYTATFKKIETTYSRLVASVGQGEGLVYVSSTDDAPDNADYTTHSDVSLVKTSAVDPHKYYLHAKASDGYVFVGWYKSDDCSTNMVGTTADFEYIEGSPSNDASKPTTINLYAKFVEAYNVGTWMNNLDDDAFICQLSIPGAHDACSSNFSGTLAGIYSSTSKTQNLEIPAMLTAGLRLFDLRPCVSGNKLHINHGIATTSYDFDPVMQQIVNYVTANPSEFCIVVIRHESEGDSNNSNFGSMLQASLTRIADRLVDFRPNLTVGEARGKVLFISRDNYDAPLRGGLTRDLADNRSNINDMLGGHCNGPEPYMCSWWLQDHYEISDENVKKQAIQDMLTKSVALAGKYDYTWVVNQTSGYKGTTSSASAYLNNAKSSNKHMTDLLLSGNYPGPAGLVFMDYAGTDDNNGYGTSLTETLIAHNFTYTMSKQSDVIKNGNDTYLLPRGRELMWSAKTYRKEGPQQPGGEDGAAASALDGVTAPATNWNAVDFDDSSWSDKLFPTASEGTGAPHYSFWRGTYNTLWIRRTFEIEHVSDFDTYEFQTYHDDDYVVYVNGNKIDEQNGWNTDFNNYRKITINKSYLRNGKNVLAVQVQQNWGGAYFDCGILQKRGNRPDSEFYSRNVTEGNYGTICLPCNVKAEDLTGGEFYKAVGKRTVNGQLYTLVTESVESLEAGTSYIFKATADEITAWYSAPYKTTPVNGAMIGNLGTGNMTVPNGYYILKDNKIHLINGATASIAPNRAYINVNALSEYTGNVNAKGIVCFDVEGVTTGIDNLSPALPTREGAYNLAGQRVNASSARGIVIVNGKKVVIK